MDAVEAKRQPPPSSSSAAPVKERRSRGKDKRYSIPKNDPRTRPPLPASTVSPPSSSTPFLSSNVQETQVPSSAAPVKKRRSRGKPKSKSTPSPQENNPRTRPSLPASTVSPITVSPPSSSTAFSFSNVQANLIPASPPLTFEGQILYSSTEDEVEKAAMQLLEVLEIKKKETGHVAIGFDVEWKPTFRKGVLPNKAAVIQLCVDIHFCHVMHIFHSGIPQSLRSLLEDSTIIKVGAGIRGDAVKVFRDYNVSVQAVEDLSDLANQKLNIFRRCWGLASLTEVLVCRKLPKPKKIKMGNWELFPLSEEQQQYAATDAFASWHIYQTLKGLPDAVRTRKIQNSASAPTK